MAAATVIASKDSRVDTMFNPALGADDIADLKSVLREEPQGARPTANETATQR